MTEKTPEERIAALGLTLPDAPAPLANYVPYRWAGNLLFLSGQGPRRPDGGFEVGRLGKDATIEDGYRAARLTGLQLLAVAKSAIGELSRIEAVVKVARHGQRRTRLRRSSQSHQRLLRSPRRSARGRRPACPLGRRHGLATQRHHGRDRGDPADPTLVPVSNVTALILRRPLRKQRGSKDARGDAFGAACGSWKVLRGPFGAPQDEAGVLLQQRLRGTAPRRWR